jgi:asparagine synthase (glutamine-hydrolysing)
LPGLCGSLSLDYSSPVHEIGSSLRYLSYGRATFKEKYQSEHISFGCAHLGTGGQRALYDSPKVAVAFYGYLTEPVIPPGADKINPSAAAQYIHDQYLEKEERFFIDLMGAFAFVIWDKRSKKLLVVSDRLGLRPIYYVAHEGILYFASEVKALLVETNFPRNLDFAAVSEFFHFRYILGNRTFFENVRLLPPASYLRSFGGVWKLRKYWDPPYPERIPIRSNAWYNHRICETLEAAVKRMIRPDLKYGISLSSGMDSRWIAAILGQLRPDTMAFTFSGAVTSETEVDIASKVAGHVGLEHFRLTLSPDFLADHAERITYISDGMHSFVDSQEFPLILEMSNLIDIAVGGFMGSGFFGENPIHHFVRPQDVFKLRVSRSKAYRPPLATMELLFGVEKYREMKKIAYKGLLDAVAEAPSKRGFQIANFEAIRQRQRRFTFYAQLLKTPYVEMYHPIADNHVWELALQLPPTQLVYKRAFRRALDSYNPHLAALPWNSIPGSATASIFSVLTQQAYSMIKRRISRALGVSTNGLISSNLQDYSTWLRGPLRSFVEASLLTPSANATGLFNPEGLVQVVRDHLENRRDATSFLGLALPFALWTRMFFTPETIQQPDIITTTG